MAKIISYRQKLLDLARIYKIYKIFDKNIKYTTYEIELLLLKNKVPLPSRKSYISLRLFNEVINPFYDLLRKKFSINIKVTKLTKNLFGDFKKKLSINFSYSKYLKNFFDGIENYFKFIISNILNFFKILIKTIIDGLNNLYNFKLEEKI